VDLVQWAEQAIVVAAPGLENAGRHPRRRPLALEMDQEAYAGKKAGGCLLPPPPTETGLVKRLCLVSFPIGRDRVPRLLLRIVACPIPVYQDHGLVPDNPGIVA
jgi:hypothetical protein